MSIKDERNELNLTRLHNPQSGDYWHEMFSPIFIVMGIDEDKDAVYVIDGRGMSGKEVDTDKDVLLVDKTEFIRVLSWTDQSGDIKAIGDVTINKYTLMCKDWNNSGRPYTDRRVEVLSKKGVYKELIKDGMWIVSDGDAVKTITGVDVDSITTKVTYPAVVVRTMDGNIHIHNNTSFLTDQVSNFKEENNQDIWRKL